MTVRQEVGELIILPPLKAFRNEQGSLVLTLKYLEGAAELARTWPGTVTSLVALSDRPTTDLDLTEVVPGAVQTGIELRPTDQAELRSRLSRAAAVLAHLSPFEAGTARLCHAIGVPLIVFSEYSPLTERQIVDASVRNPILRLRRKLWLRWAERTRRDMLRRHVAGLQCSGTPTYDLYSPLVPGTLLFFDNRVRVDGVIGEDELACKLAVLDRDKPLRLVFGGRFIPMKGVMHLPRVAEGLARLDVPFRMDIVGGGPLEDELRAAIASAGLGDRITLHAGMDFRSGWLPFLRERADLFVCCHLQGDPSSTYPEVMSCGVPIAGYDNEAFVGVVRESRAGWTVPMGDPAALAGQIARLARNRGEIADAATRGRGFAAEHAFERTFARRVRHLLKSAGREIAGG